jgi:alpha-beta hydrolase superfamily lysophospholipase
LNFLDVLGLIRIRIHLKDVAAHVMRRARAMASTRYTSGAWTSDVLGEGFEQCTLELRSGGLATLVRYRRPSRWPRLERRRTFVVLYVHGWSDYFFQTDLGRFWHEQGAAFYAIDLHNYGRSLRPGLVPGFVTNLQEYDEDLDAALDHIRADGHATLPLVLLGHSTGGLTLSLWAARNPGAATALILNSPWLEFQASGTARKVITPFLGLEARRHPLAPLPPVDRGIYARALREASDGHLEYNELWRPRRGFQVPFAFLYAVMQGQATVEEGLQLDLPVLVLLSDKSYLQPTWSSDAASADVALNVEIVAHRSLSLGNYVTIARIHNALHDVILSTPEPRAHAYNILSEWASDRIKAPRTAMA